MQRKKLTLVATTGSYQEANKMYLPGAVASVSLWICALTVKEFAEAHRSNDRIGRPSEMISPSSAFISGPSHIPSSFGANGAKVSHAVRAKNSVASEVCFIGCVLRGLRDSSKAETS